MLGDRRPVLCRRRTVWLGQVDDDQPIRAFERAAAKLSHFATADLTRFGEAVRNAEPDALNGFSRPTATLT